jgi:hypothetical protein
MATFVQKIPSEEQEWLSDSFIDPNGRVFQWRGEIYAACNEKVEAANPVSHNLEFSHTCPKAGSRRALRVATTAR